MISHDQSGLERIKASKDLTFSTGSNDMSRPVTVYLDSQDYSRFGDVLRGKADAASETLFHDLLLRKEQGKAVFALSMPLLGELLQYDGDFRETTVRKAEAVELLCGSCALAFPSRLVAREIAVVAQDAGMTERVALPPALTNDRYWYPNVGDTLESFKADLLAHAHQEVSNFPLPNRNARRAAKKLVRKLNFFELARQGAPEMADRMGLPLEAVTGSIVALLRGSITSAEASRRLFNSIAEPGTFVELYFERLENDRSLPSWIKEAGAGFAKAFAQIKEAIEPLLGFDGAPQMVRTLLADKKPEFAALALMFARDDLSEFGLTQEAFEAIKSDSTLTQKVSASNIVANILEAYTLQIVGVTAKDASIEQSFAGDMMHSFYLPYVDLWRGDRRYSEALRRAMPMHANRIVGKLSELPVSIDQIYASRVDGRVAF